MIVATLLKWVGVAMFAGGALMWMIALLHIAPGRSRISAYMRGSFQTEKDYTPAGWRLIVWGRRLSFAGFALILVSIFALGGS
jgi:hypothetical protein